MAAIFRIGLNMCVKAFLTIAILSDPIELPE